MMLIKFCIPFFLIGSLFGAEISSIVVPAAGLGTRFLPITKVLPKELLPVYSKTALEWIIDEMVHAGCIECDLIVSAIKRPRMECALKHITGLQWHLIDQPVMKGLGHAILMAQEYITASYFGVILPDMLFLDNESAFNQLNVIARRYPATIIGVQKVPLDQVSSYGIVDIDYEIESGLFCLKGLVEKPQPKHAPSCYAVMGRYILSSKIFSCIQKTFADSKGEIQLTDAIAQLIMDGEPVLAYELQGTLFDVGQPAGWLAANNYCFEHERIFS